MKLAIAIVLLCISLFACPALALAADPAGTELFQVHCAGCHVNGGNIIRRGKNLKLKTLQRNQMASQEAIAQIVANGKANMSAYKDRLSDQQIQAVSAYVLEQAAQGWR